MMYGKNNGPGDPKKKKKKTASLVSKIPTAAMPTDANAILRSKGLKIQDSTSISTLFQEIGPKSRRNRKN